MNDIQHTESCIALGHDVLCMGECTREASENIKTALSGALGSALDFLIDGDDDEIASRLNVATSALLAEFDARGIMLLVPGTMRIVGDTDDPSKTYIETTLISPAEKHADTTLRLQVAGEEQFISVGLTRAKIANLLGYGEQEEPLIESLRREHREEFHGVGFPVDTRYSHPACPLCNGTEAA